MNLCHVHMSKVNILSTLSIKVNFVKFTVFRVHYTVGGFMAFIFFTFERC